MYNNTADQGSISELFKPAS